MTKKRIKPEGFTVNRISDLSGLDRMTCRRRLADVKPLNSKGKVKFYSAEDALRALKPGQVRQSPNATLEGEKMRKQIEAIDIANAKARGDFRPVNELKQAATRFSFSVRDLIWTMPRRVAGRLALMTDPVEIEGDLRSEVREILTLVSRTPFGEFHCPKCKAKIAAAESVVAEQKEK
jgi:hypothetical protein